MKNLDSGDSHNLDSNHADTPWVFDKNELQIQFEIISKVKEGKNSPVLTYLDEVLHHVHTFVSHLLRGNYKKQEIGDIVEYLALLIENITYWAGVVYSENTEQLRDQSSFVYVCRILNKSIGLHKNYSTFHCNYKKSLPKNAKISENIGNLPKLTQYFLWLFKKSQGFELILKMLLLK